jgi:hypothetical protein
LEEVGETRWGAQEQSKTGETEEGREEDRARRRMRERKM